MAVPMEDFSSNGVEIFLFLFLIFVLCHLNKMNLPTRFNTAIHLCGGGGKGEGFVENFISFPRKIYILIFINSPNV